ncbi:hypothetical protein MIND_01202000 [Mycena indigotica]|uniref:Uncharacterized protein n=1 Tax=Mycena indigotica TaxID=2126181 RepID=A0A8H6VV24_9AGAR|nr:uncharacterized protein MIND_01202000 [Mycena indigotica]KAF7293026.1 hypothetical protein MIND_01202000 [Mycena indigotica]
MRSGHDMSPLLHIIITALFAQTALGLVPAGYTPNGKPIFQAPPGSSIQQSGKDFDVFAPNGTLIHVFEGAHTGKTRAQGSNLALTRRGDYSLTEALTIVNSSDIIQSFDTSFIVPPEPAAFNSQLFFFGAGIGLFNEHDSNTLFPLLQVGLQYGGTTRQGGSFWTAVIVLEQNDGSLLQISSSSSNPVVREGDRISVSIASDPGHPQGPTPSFWYRAGFGNTGPAFPFNVGIMWQQLPQKATFRLEEFGVTLPNEYPTGSVTFEDVNLSLTTGHPSISWTANVDPATDLTIEVERDSSENAQIAIIFPENS